MNLVHKKDLPSIKSVNKVIKIKTVENSLEKEIKKIMSRKTQLKIGDVINSSQLEKRNWNKHNSNNNSKIELVENDSFNNKDGNSLSIENNEKNEELNIINKHYLPLTNKAFNFMEVDINLTPNVDAKYYKDVHVKEKRIKSMNANNFNIDRNNVKKINSNFNEMEETFRVGMLNYNIAKDTKFDFKYHKKQDIINSNKVNYEKVRDNFAVKKIVIETPRDFDLKKNNAMYSNVKENIHSMKKIQEIIRKDNHNKTYISHNYTKILNSMFRDGQLEEVLTDKLKEDNLMNNLSVINTTSSFSKSEIPMKNPEINTDKLKKECLRYKPKEFYNKTFDRLPGHYKHDFKVYDFIYDINVKFKPNFKQKEFLELIKIEKQNCFSDSSKLLESKQIFLNDYFNYLYKEAFELMKKYQKKLKTDKN